MHRLIVQGNVNGRGSRGRSPTSWWAQIKSITELTVTEASHYARNGEVWAITVADVMPYHHVQLYRLNVKAALES